MYKSKQKILTIILSLSLFISMFCGVVPQNVFADAGSDKDITAFSVNGQVGQEVIDAGNHTVTFHMPYGMNITGLSPAITVSPNASINPNSGFTRNFTNPVTYTVTAQDNSTVDWTVTCVVDLNTAKDITGFSVNNQQGGSNIDAVDHTITFKMFPGANLTALVPTINISGGASISPNSGVPQNFLSSVVYTVTAEDNSTQVWTVTCENAVPETMTFTNRQLQNNSLDLSWAAVNNATSYKVIYASDYGFNNDRHTAIITAPDNFCAIDVSASPGITGWDVYIIANDVNGTCIARTVKTYVGGKTISGTLSRPNGYPASGAIDVNVIAEVSQQPNDITWNVTIPDGDQSAAYSIDVPDNQSYNIRYDIQSGAGVLRHGYIKTAFYKTGPPPMDEHQNNASNIPINGDDVNGINLTLMPAKLISGTIALPNGQFAPQGGYNINMNAMNQSLWISSQVTILEGQNSANYNIIIEDSLGVTNFKVTYGFAQGSIPGYFNNAFYAAGATTPQDRSATNVSIAQGNVAGINLTLISCKTISGIIQLPPQQVAPQGGLQINVDARDDNGTQDQNDDIDMNAGVTIAAGQSSIAFSISVLDNHTYKLFFQPQEGSGYVSPQFYKSTGVVLSYNSADNIAVNGSNITVSDAQNPTVLVSSLTISGDITLPGGQMAPQGGIQIQVGAFNNQQQLYYGKNVTITEGNTYVAFSIDVQDGKSYKLRAEPESGKGYVSPVLYKNGGVVFSEDAADPINVSGSSIGNKNIELIQGKVISGTINRQSGSGHFDISIFIRKYVDDKNNPTLSEQHFTVGDGETSKTFSLTVPADNNLKLGYCIIGQDGFPGYLSSGYYSSNGTKSNMSDADTLDLSNDITGITFNMAKASMITGTVALPVGKTAAGDINVNVNGWLDNNTPNNKQDDLNASANVKILQGQSSAQFTLSIPDGIDSNVTLRATPDSQSPYTSSSEFDISIAGGLYEGDAIKLELSECQLKGVVYEPGVSTNPVSWSYINIRQKDSPNYIPGFSTDEQGNFSIGGLDDGTYILTAMTWGTSFTNSEEIQISVTNKLVSATSVALVNGLLEIHLTSPQINGVVKNKNGGNAKGGYVDVLSIS
jgi:hypothetical protein